MRKDFNYNMLSYEFTTFSREDNYNGSLMVKFFFFQPLDVRMRKKEAQQQEPPPEDLQQEVEILKGNSFTLPEIAFSKFDIKRHIKQIQTEHIRKRQIVQEAKLPLMFSPGGGCTSTNSLLGCHPTLQILTQDPISDQYLSLPLEKTREIMIM